MRGKRLRSRKLWSDLASTRLVRDAASLSVMATRSASSASPQPQARTSPATRSKYRNIATKGFSSKREYARHQALLLLQQAGRIADLRTQVPFRIEINGMLVCKYVADSVYREGGLLVVEDCKGYRTPIYRLKAKLMRAALGITIRET